MFGRIATIAVGVLAAFPSVGRGQAPSGAETGQQGPAPSSNNRYAAELIERARGLELDSDLQWIRLGHWRKPHYPTRFVYYLSEADGPGFFLAPNGKRSPSAELEATLKAFATGRGADEEHPICRFPARFAWLDRMLHFDPERMAIPACPKLTEFITSMRPGAITVVFSSYFMSKAASAYGHTFLRVERDDPSMATVDGKRRQLLDTGIDYAATVTTSNALLYAFMGMTGGFRGGFKKMPYYYKVREYNDFESRDLWEYRLALTPQQRTLLIAHLWELGHTYFDYFYLTENCSYHILSVVDVARPELGLVDSLRVPVVPADTIKAISNVPGLVAEITYRPSLNTQFKERVKHLHGGEEALVSRLARDPAAPLPASMPTLARVRVLDAAADLVDLLWAKEILDPTSEGAALKLALLKRRAQIRAPSEELVIEPPWRDQPHRAHDSSRLGYGGGWREGVGPFLALTGRVNLHDHLDNPNGYPEQSAIEFLPFEARLYVEPDDPVYDNSLRLEKLSLIRITQLSSFTGLDRKIAWSVDVGGARIRDEGCDDCFAAMLGGGAGLARALAGGKVLGFALMNAGVNWAPDLDGLGSTGFRIGVGPRAGVRLRFRNDLIAMIDGEGRWLPALDPVIAWEARGALRWHMAEHFSLDVAAMSGNSTDFEARTSLLHYF